ncbi:MAG: EAL domain-containing protein [Eubacteriales bacterium]|nr:EAL domain-containing protein [Eubacteriales bacterium]MDD3881225.1 EAL domain-containing protein [Eubacteriales bacterium]MDD4512143.1 EAL domain-containing protein [Eubacteriales bacterium]
MRGEKPSSSGGAMRRSLTLMFVLEALFSLTLIVLSFCGVFKSEPFVSGMQLPPFIQVFSIFTFSALAVSAVCLLAGAIVIGRRSKITRRASLCYLAAFVLAMGLWILYESGAIDGLFTKTLTWRLAKYVFFALMPIPFCLFVSELSPHYSRVQLSLCAVYEIIFACDTLWMCLNSFKYPYTLWLTQGFMVLIAVSAIVIAVLEYKKYGNRDLRYMIFGSCLLVGFSLCALIVNLFLKSSYVTTLMSLGVLLFLLCLCLGELRRAIDMIASAQSIERVSSSTPVCVCQFVLKRPYECIYVNEEFLRVFGRTREQVSELGLGAKSVLKADRERITEEMVSHIAARDKLFNIEGRILTASGEYSWMLMRFSADWQHEIVTSVIVDIAGRKAAEEKLKMSEEESRIALRQSDKDIFRYDIAEKRLEKRSRHDDSAGASPALENVPASELAAGFIAQESVDAFLEFYFKISSGAKNGSAIIRRRAEEGAPLRWYRADFTNVFMADGLPQYAIITRCDITEQRERELAYERLRLETDSVSDEKILIVECDLTHNICKDVRGSLLTPFPNGCELTFDEYVSQRLQTIAPEDRQAFSSLFLRSFLLDSYYANNRCFTIECRHYTPRGEKWVRYALQLVQQSGSSDVFAFVIARDIDAEKREQIAIKARSEHDALTGALNRATFIGTLSAQLARSGDVKIAVCIMDMDHFKKINDRFGHTVGDKMLIDAMDAVRAVLRPDDLIGRLGGDEFMICMRGVPGRELVARKLEMIGEKLKKPLSDDLMVSASFGIAMSPDDSRSFTELYRMADAALYSTKEHGRGGYSFYTAQMSLDGHEHILTEIPESEGETPKRAILVVSDEEAENAAVREALQSEYEVYTEKSGIVALETMRARAFSLVIISETVADMDWRSMLSEMSAQRELSGIPAVLTGSSGEDSAMLYAAQAGAADYLCASADAKTIYMRVNGTINRVENEKLRMQNRYLLMQSETEERYASVLEATGTVVCGYTPQTAQFTYSDMASRYLMGNYDHRPIWQIFIEDNVASEAETEQIKTLILRAGESASAPRSSITVKLKNNEGALHWFRVQIMRTLVGGVKQQVLITFNDIDQEAETRRKLSFMAEYDSLTGLLNKNGFESWVGELLKTASKSRVMALVAFDVNSFSMYNAVNGTQAGDDLLQIIAREAKAALKSNESAARYSDDNFALLMSDTSIERIVERIRDSAGEKALESRGYSVLISYGVYEITDLTIPVSAMYDRATAAKDSVKGNYETHIGLYSEEMYLKRLEDAKLIADQEEAMERGEFVAYYQPKYQTSSECIVGAEALVRWIKPDGTIIPPARFIELFERNGQIMKLDFYVLSVVCDMLSTLIASGVQPVPVSVNFSRAHLFDESFVDRMNAICLSKHVEPKYIEVELTESTFRADSELIGRVIDHLHMHGFAVSVDDFGSGYSSLNILKDIAVDTLKVDMKFLSGFEKGGKVGTMVTSVVRMAKWMGLSIVAEGVETRDQVAFLRSVGSDVIQGYYYSKPLPRADFTERLVSQPRFIRPDEPESENTDDLHLLMGGNKLITKLIDGSSGGFGLYEYTDGKLELVRSNREYSAILGSEPEPMDDDNTADSMRLIAPEDRNVLAYSIKKAWLSGDAVKCSLRRQMKDGSWLPLSCFVTALGGTKKRMMISITFVKEEEKE